MELNFRSIDIDVDNSVCRHHTEICKLYKPPPTYSCRTSRRMPSLIKWGHPAPWSAARTQGRRAFEECILSIDQNE